MNNKRNFNYRPVNIQSLLKNLAVAITLTILPVSSALCGASRTNIKVGNPVPNPNYDGTYSLDLSYTFSTTCAVDNLTITFTGINAYGNTACQVVSTTSPSYQSCEGVSITSYNSFTETRNPNREQNLQYSATLRFMSLKTVSSNPTLSLQSFGKNGSCQEGTNPPLPPVPPPPSTCNVTTASADVDLGNWYLNDLPSIGSVTEARNIPLSIQCENASSSSVSVKINAKSDPSDNSHNIMLDSGGAQGMAIQITDGDNNPIPINQSFTALNSLVPGTNNLNIKGRYIRTAQMMNEGDANATVTVAITYD
jgi:type 1 fimbria pilin